jgi:signal transduction histidine kinase
MQAISNLETKNYRRLVTAVQELSLANDLDDVVQIVRKVARELTGADGATFIIRENDLCFYAEENAISPLWKGSRFPIDSCVSGWAMINKQQVVIEDIYSDPRIPVELYKPTFVKSLAMVPIRTVDPIGAIGNYWASNHVPGSDEIDLLQSLADITAVAIENVKVKSELERRVKERTEELEELNRELEAFSYSVSHDLRAPLRGINGFMSILLEDHGDKLDEGSKKIVGKVMRNASHMTSLIDNLLTFFKMGKKELVKTKLPMKLMATEILRDLREVEKNRTISTEIKELPEVMGDAVLVKQVWLNLISNALKYSSGRQNTVIEIGFLKKDEKTVYYVKDNGAGFEMEYYNKLFAVFQRLHSQREFEGTGIGLAIVEKIISKHGGRIWAESKVEEGATFYFTFA